MGAYNLYVNETVQTQIKFSHIYHMKVLSSLTFFELCELKKLSSDYHISDAVNHQNSSHDCISIA